jgi:hypothetical protein
MASLSSMRFRAMRSMEAYTRDALHRPDLGEAHIDPSGGIDNLLCDEDLTRPGVLGDPRGEVHRSSVVIALLEEHRSEVQASVSGRQAGRRYAVYQLQGRYPAGFGSRKYTPSHSPAVGTSQKYRDERSVSPR